MKELSIDIETYSPIDLACCGVYKYAEHPDFTILLFGYAVDDGEVQVVDLAKGGAHPRGDSFSPHRSPCDEVGLQRRF